MITCYRHPFFVLVFLLIVCDNWASEVVWDGGASTSSWFDALNWDGDIIPTANDTVIITANDTVIISSAGAVANRLRLNNGAGLILKTNSSLVLDGSDFNGMLFRNRATLTIAQSASLTIRNTGASGIRVNGPNAKLNNSGTITFGPNIGAFGVVVANFPNVGISINNSSTGLIQTSHGSGAPFMLLARRSSLTNSGRIIADLQGADIDFMVLLGGLTSLTNQEGGVITASNVGDDGLNIDNGATFSNSGVINLNNIMDQAMDISFPGGGTNESSGTINISGVMDEEGIDLTTTFINNGVINISDVQSEDGIDIEAPGSLVNNGTINITLNGSDPDMEAIDIEANASLTNTRCGLINVLSQHPLEISEPNSALFNSGVIASVFTGSNNNNGEFWNEGEIVSPSGLFDIAPNAINAGSFPPVPFSPINTVTTGAVPATSLCAVRVPTMDQWSVIILSLLLLIVAVRKVSLVDSLIQS